MVQFGNNLLTLLVLAAGVNGYTWSKCRNAPQCLVSSYNGASTTGGSKNVAKGARFSYVGGYVFAYDVCSGFAYEPKDGYWYSHDKDGLFISPTGYMRSAHDCNMVAVQSKSGTIGTTYWVTPRGGNCCLPDSVGTNILNVGAYYTGPSS